MVTMIVETMLRDRPRDLEAFIDHLFCILPKLPRFRRGDTFQREDEEVVAVQGQTMKGIEPNQKTLSSTFLLKQKK